MEGKHGKAIVISNFAGMYRAQIVDFDKGGAPEKISLSLIDVKQIYQIAVDWHKETGYPIFEKTLTNQNNKHGNSNHLHGLPRKADSQNRELQPTTGEHPQANG